VITFDDGSRVVFRLSGTGSQGATVRLYVERYVDPKAGAEELGKSAAEGLKSLIEVALEISKLKEFLGRDEPNVITVSFLFFIVGLMMILFFLVVTCNRGNLVFFVYYPNECRSSCLVIQVG
jgi:hypothetical protein